MIHGEVFSSNSWLIRVQFMDDYIMMIIGKVQSLRAFLQKGFQNQSIFKHAGQGGLT